MEKRFDKIMVVGVSFILMFVTLPTIVGKEIEVSNNPVEFTFTGPTVVTEGEKCWYTFNLSPNPESDEYIVKVHWKEGDMIIYEYPRDGVFYTGVDNEIWYVWYKSYPWDSGVYYPKATAYCGNSTYEATLEVTVPKNKPFSHYQPNWLFEYFPLLYRLLQFIR